MYFPSFKVVALKPKGHLVIYGFLESSGFPIFLTLTQSKKYVYIVDLIHSSVMK